MGLVSLKIVLNEILRHIEAWSKIWNVFYFLFFNTQPIKLDDLFTGLSSKGINGSFFFFIQYIKKFKFSSQLAVVKHIQISLDFSRLMEGLFRLIGELNDEKISCKLKDTKAPIEAQFERC